MLAFQRVDTSTHQLGSFETSLAKVKGQNQHKNWSRFHFYENFKIEVV